VEAAVPHSPASTSRDPSPRDPSGCRIAGPQWI